MNNTDCGASANRGSLNSILKRVNAWFGRAKRLADRWLGRRAGTDSTSEAAALIALRAPAPRVRWQAAMTLGRHPQRSPAALAALVTALADPEPFVRWHAIEALAHQEASRVFPLLTMTLSAPDPFHRAGAAEALGRLGGEAACLMLRRCTADPDPIVRAAVAHALGACGDLTSAPALLPLLADADPAVRRAAAASIGCSNDAATAAEAAAALAAALVQEQHLLVRRAMTAALVHVAHPSAQPALLRALADSDPQVRGYAAQALGQIGDERAHAALLELKADDGRLLHGAVGDVVRAGLTMLERRGRRGPLAALPEAH
jgi:HEAT repeat protein